MDRVGFSGRFENFCFEGQEIDAIRDTLPHENHSHGLSLTLPPSSTVYMSYPMTAPVLPSDTSFYWAHSLAPPEDTMSPLAMNVNNAMVAGIQMNPNMPTAHGIAMTTNMHPTAANYSLRALDPIGWQMAYAGPSVPIEDQATLHGTRSLHQHVQAGAQALAQARMERLRALREIPDASAEGPASVGVTAAPVKVARQHRALAPKIQAHQQPSKAGSSLGTQSVASMKSGSQAPAMPLGNQLDGSMPEKVARLPRAPTVPSVGLFPVSAILRSTGPPRTGAPHDSAKCNIAQSVPAKAGHARPALEPPVMTPPLARPMVQRPATRRRPLSAEGRRSNESLTRAFFASRLLSRTLSSSVVTASADSRQSLELRVDENGRAYAHTSMIPCNSGGQLAKYPTPALEKGSISDDDISVLASSQRLSFVTPDGGPASQGLTRPSSSAKDFSPGSTQSSVARPSSSSVHSEAETVTTADDQDSTQELVKIIDQQLQNQQPQPAVSSMAASAGLAAASAARLRPRSVPFMPVAQGANHQTALFPAPDDVPMMRVRCVCWQVRDPSGFFVQW